ncbi:MAG: GNAT family N-acetyltransferase [Saprospiraceae bacterium]|nr:GNAT family N-acetyltransferase [Saprospiraceae bacterium]
MEIQAAIIEFGTPEYDEEVSLRTLVLRKPLGMEFTTEQLAAEFDSIHLGAYAPNDVLAGCLILTPLDDDRIKMRQVAVHPDFQDQGIGGQLVAYSENLARSMNFKTMVLHARKTAARFYEKLSYQMEGEEFKEVGIPHCFMYKNL